MLITKVKSMLSPKSGSPVANQYVITIYIKDMQGRKVASERVFQSYDTIIARERTLDGKITLDKDYWDYSKTTGKYRNMFLGEFTKETRAKIKSGEYKLAELN